jgi:hypothetical protein
MGMLLLEGLAALAAKIASASTIAQATAGLGIAVAGVTGAGAAGVLPGPLQDGVAATVEAVTPFDLPHTADDRITGVDDSPAVPGADAVESPSTVPTVVPVTTPSTAHVEDDPEDHGAEDVEDGVHQHRGGRAEAVPAPATATPRTADDHVETHSPDTEDHRGGNSGHGSDDSGSDDSGSDDSSGHGGGDD